MARCGWMDEDSDFSRGKQVVHLCPHIGPGRLDALEPIHPGILQDVMNYLGSFVVLLHLVNKSNALDSSLRDLGPNFLGFKPTRIISILGKAIMRIGWQLTWQN